MALSDISRRHSNSVAFGVKRTLSGSRCAPDLQRLTQLGNRPTGTRTVLGTPNWGGTTWWQIATLVQNNSGHPVQLACRPVAG